MLYSVLIHLKHWIHWHLHDLRGWLKNNLENWHIGHTAATDDLKGLRELMTYTHLFLH